MQLSLQRDGGYCLLHLLWCPQMGYLFVLICLIVSALYSSVLRLKRSKLFISKGPVWCSSIVEMLLNEIMKRLGSHCRNPPSFFNAQTQNLKANLPFSEYILSILTDMDLNCNLCVEVYKYIYKYLNILIFSGYIYQDSLTFIVSLTNIIQLILSSRANRPTFFLFYILYVF